MIDLDDLRARPDVYQDAAKKKNIAVSIVDFLKLDQKRRELQKEVDGMRSTQNTTSKKMPSLKGDEKNAVLAEMKTLSAKVKEGEERLKALETEWRSMQYMLPAIPLDTVPVGKSDKENVESKRVGAEKKFSFTPKDHVTLGEALDIIDIPRGAKVSGARSYFLKGDGAQLHQAVLRYTMDSLVAKGWTLFAPPLMANEECFIGTGFFPGADQANIYAVGGQEKPGAPIEADNLHLIGTSEVTVCSYHSGELLTEADLPKRYAGYSACFRREAGTYGKDTKGLYRVHQFEKVEQVVLCEANTEMALAMFEEIRKNAEDILQALELPYRIVDVCTGDMGKGKVFMQDIETWMPSRNGYGETHSCSYLGDFQARRLNIKYTTKDGEKKFVHTLNNTCIASPRILIPILEIYQNKDGSVTVPEVLRGYMGGQKTIKKTA
ncbi:MAG: seryl-tRNA synthetase [Candidatus Peregrinibacteria bacterium Greene1014_49]|nr:MAG: seryl-tRNA synthetase [Candidatus Peregrinibacteria bacterium Greene1014_49]